MTSTAKVPVRWPVSRWVIPHTAVTPHAIARTEGSRSHGSDVEKGEKTLSIR